MLRSVMVRAAVVALLGSWSATAPQAAESARQIDIPASELADALILLSKRYGVELFYRPEQVRGVRTDGVSGSLTTEQAVSELIKGTPLKLRTDASGAMVIGVRSADENKASAAGDANAASKPLRIAQASPSTPTQPTTAAEASQSIDEVVVTAQKREERLQDVPISISVLSGETLDRHTGSGVTEALRQVPGVTLSQSEQVGGTQVTVRGVAAAGAFYSGSSPVAYYIDSVPFSLVKSSILPDTNAYDLQRIEALRGPQGTLYGANALNGVVRILTLDPDLSDFQMKGRASLSNSDGGGMGYRGDLVVNAPIVADKIAVRAVIGYNDVGGWIDTPNNRDANDARLRNARLKVSIQPTDELSIGLFGWSSRADYGAPGNGDPEDRFPGLLDQSNVSDFDIAGLKFVYDFERFSVSSMTSHIDYVNHSRVDYTSDGLVEPFVTDIDSEVFSQEIIFSSTGAGDWRWSAGGFYRDAEDGLIQTLVDFTDASESFAVFGEVTRLFADGRFELTGGLRYFEDRVQQRENIPLSGDPSQPLQNDRSTFNHVSPRVVLSWHPRDWTTLYASYSEGFRSGYNQSALVTAAAPGFAPVNEDKLKNYELGSKGRLFDGLMDFDAAVYYIDWQDVQQTAGIPSPFVPGTYLFATVNGEAASGMGADLALSARPARGLDLGASVSWNDLTLDDPVSSFGVVLFKKGDRLNYSPRLTAGGSAEYTFPMGASGLDMRLSTSANYSDRVVYRTVSGDSVSVRAGSNIWNVGSSLSLLSQGKWTASLFVDNATNDRGALNRQVPDFYTLRVRPRTYGLQFEYHLGL